MLQVTLPLRPPAGERKGREQDRGSGRRHDEKEGTGRGQRKEEEKGGRGLRG